MENVFVFIELESFLAGCGAGGGGTGGAWKVEDVV